MTYVYIEQDAALAVEIEALGLDCEPSSCWTLLGDRCLEACFLVLQELDLYSRILVAKSCPLVAPLKPSQCVFSEFQDLEGTVNDNQSTVQLMKLINPRVCCSGLFEFATLA